MYISKNFSSVLRPAIILILILHIFIAQSFLPLYSSSTPVCSNNGGVACTSPNEKPVCSHGKFGTPVCGSHGVIACLTSISLFPDYVECVPNDTSSSSGGSCPACLPSGATCPIICTQQIITCNGTTYSDSCDYQKRYCGCTCGAILCPLGCNVDQNTCMCNCTSSSSSGSTAQCGSATCKNGEVCVTVDPCRGRPGCYAPIAQFCALPNATPYCSNSLIQCNLGTPICNNSNIPVCGSSLGFLNDLSGPGCTNASKTILNVNSAYCSTSNLRNLKENKTKCNTKKLCPSGKRFNLCREDRHACKCICPFDVKTNTVAPRCNKHNHATCPGGLTPTCSKADNIASCYSGKLTCANKYDGSIDLIDTIDCK